MEPANNAQFAVDLTKRQMKQLDEKLCNDGSRSRNVSRWTTRHGC